MQEPEDQLRLPKVERRILLLGDLWSSIRDGIPGVNRNLALSLTRYKGTKVYSTFFGDESQLNPVDRKEIQDNHVQLIYANMNGYTEPQKLYPKVNEDPLSVFPDIEKQVANATFIVGHAPITAQAALKLKNDLYPNAKVILFYHTIPPDVDWLGIRLPYVLPSDTELVSWAEQADVVYSVTDKCHWYYTAKFRNRAKSQVDLRPFFPQCSERVFTIPRKPCITTEPKILVLGDGNDFEDWLGLDVAACAANKIAKASVAGSSTRPVLKMKIAGIAASKLESVKEKLKPLTNHPDLKIEYSTSSDPEELYRDLSECSLCLVPSRAEPFGTLGLFALSAGIPTLIAKDSGLATVISRLTSEPEYFAVPVTPNTLAVRQDGSFWRDRVLALLQDPETAHERAMQLRTALRRDEPTKESHDNFIAYCLGGITLQHEAKSIEVLLTADEDKELPIQRRFNEFLTAVMKQCWRLKHHPLTKSSDLFELLPGLHVPIADLVKQVTDKVEDKDRRILGLDSNTGAFVVYCPTPDALSDLWSMCDVINERLVTTLMVGDPCPILRHFKLKTADIQTTMIGPEFIKYKKELLRNMVL